MKETTAQRMYRRQPTRNSDGRIAFPHAIVVIVGTVLLSSIATATWEYRNFVAAAASFMPSPSGTKCIMKRHVKLTNARLKGKIPIVGDPGCGPSHRQVLVGTVPKSGIRVTSSLTLTMARIPLLGRFRKKRQVDPPPKPVQVGDLLPEVDVEVLKPGQSDSTSDGETSQVVNVTMTLREVVQDASKAILIGMPGAFTPTCTREHLPGYVQNAAKFAALGIERIAVLTTNDRFVNEEWANAIGLFETTATTKNNRGGDFVCILSDGDGDAVKAMGLAEDMGFGVGIRSQRFVILTERGRVTDIYTDPGMNECSATRADMILALLSPPGSTKDGGDGAIEIDFKLILGAGAALVIGLLSLTFSSGPAPPPPAPTPPPPPVVIQQRSKTAPAPKQEFFLLRDHL